MKLLIIGANGRLGAYLTRFACDRGHEVTALVNVGDCNEQRVKQVIHGSLFDLTRDQVRGYDAVLSAFGGGFGNDPTINRRAIDQMIGLLSGTETAYITVGGAGSLYPDDTHAAHVCELPEHPEFLREISRQILLGLGDLRESKNLSWTFVCPSLFFDYEAPLSGYRIGTEQQVLYGENGESRVGYADFANAMLDIAEQGSYRGQCITVCEPYENGGSK